MQEFIGSERYNQNINHFNNNLYSQPPIETNTQILAEDKRRITKELFGRSPIINPKESTYNINSVNTQRDISDYYIAEDKNIRFPNEMASRENVTSSQSYLIKNENTRDSVVNINEDEYFTESKKKRSICCCPLWVCISITIAIIVFIGIMVYIFWPKIPEVSIASVVLSDAPEGSQSLRYEIPNSQNGNKGGVEIDLDIHVIVKNDNFYDLNVHNLDTRVYLQTESLDKAEIGKGSSKDLKFPKHETTEFVLPVTIGYYVEDILTDNALIYLLKSCSMQTPIKIKYEVDIGISLIEKIYKPTYKGDQSFSCPVSDVAGGLTGVLLSDIYSNIRDRKSVV